VRAKEHDGLIGQRATLKRVEAKDRRFRHDRDWDKIGVIAISKFRVTNRHVVFSMCSVLNCFLPSILLTD